MRDDELGALLRTAIPPSDAPTRGDVWPSIVERLDRPPRWSLVDLGLAAAIALALLMNPEWLLILTFHL
jgi:hypothetical protein